MAENKKSIFDRWLDKKIQNAMDTSADVLSGKIRVYLTAFYLVSMLVFVTYSIICLNNIGKMSGTLMIVFGGMFYLAFVVMAVFSIWTILKSGDKFEGMKSLNRMYMTSKILRRCLGLITYVMTVVVLFQTWEMGIQYRLFACIMLIAFSVGNLWVIVSDIYYKRLEKKMEEKRLAEIEAKKNASLKNKVKLSAEKITAGLAQVLKNKEQASENKENIDSKEDKESKAQQNFQAVTDKISEELSSLELKMFEVLNACYNQAIVGLPKVEGGVKETCGNYMQKYGDIDKAISKYVSAQIKKCSASGFITGLGGLITLPVSVPANLASVIYMQLRTITTIACMYGHDPEEEYVRTLAFACLTGSGMADILKAVGVELGENSILKVVDKLPIAVLAKINKKICTRFATKAGEKSLASFAKFIPLLGGVIGGTVDAVATQTIANNAKKVFGENVGNTADVEIQRDESDVIEISSDDFEW